MSWDSENKEAQGEAVHKIVFDHSGAEEPNVKE